MGTFLTNIMGSTGIQIGEAYSALVIASMILPFFVGMIADRYFPAQRVMGIGAYIDVAVLICFNFLFLRRK